jgi:hypothetical protein
MVNSKVQKWVHELKQRSISSLVKSFMFMTTPSSRKNAQFASPSCGLFLACGGKINN